MAFHYLEVSRLEFLDTKNIHFSIWYLYLEVNFLSGGGELPVGEKIIKVEGEGGGAMFNKIVFEADRDKYGVGKI